MNVRKISIWLVGLLAAGGAALGANPEVPRDFKFTLPLFTADSAWSQTATGAAVLPASDAQILVIYRTLMGDPADLHPDGYAFTGAPWPFMATDYDAFSISIGRCSSASTMDVALREYEGAQGYVNPSLSVNPDGTVTFPAVVGTVRPSGPQQLFADGLLVLYDSDNNMEYDFWQATTVVDGQGNSVGGGQTGTTVLATGAAAGFDVGATGASPRGNDYWSARASGPALLAGMLLPEDLESGSIDHALVIAIIAPRNLAADPFEPQDSDVFYPCSTAETDYYSTNPNALASGQRLRMRQTIVDAEGNTITESTLAPITRMFVAALRTHGTIVVDNAEGFSFYVEDYHSADLNLTDDEVNSMIGLPAGTALDPAKTKWQIVLDVLTAELEDIPIAYGPFEQGQDPATAQITTSNFDVVEAAVPPGGGTPTPTPTATETPTPTPTQTPVEGQGAPVLDILLDAGGPNLELGWTNAFDAPWMFFGLAYDYYLADWSARAPDGSIWFPFDPSATAGLMDVGFSGVYFVWITSLYADGALYVNDNPGAVHKLGTPHAPTNVWASDLGGLSVQVDWEEDPFGTWTYWFAVYDAASGEPIESTGPLGAGVWHYVLYGSDSFNSGQAVFGVPRAGEYWFAVAGMGWDGATFGELVVAVETVEP